MWKNRENWNVVKKGWHRNIYSENKSVFISNAIEMCDILLPLCLQRK